MGHFSSRRFSGEKNFVWNERDDLAVLRHASGVSQPVSY